MGKLSPRICLITPGHVSSTPRLVREAGALADAGCRVHVVAGRHYPPADPLDAGVLDGAAWTHTLVPYGRGLGHGPRKLLHLAARRMLRRRGSASVRVAARACHAESLRLAAAAARVPAQFYLGHCLGGLAAAAFAAGSRGASWGFDAEDLHEAETMEAIADRGISGAARVLQSRLLPSCARLTASSPLIAKEYRQRYGVEPAVVRNVFPLPEAPAAPGAPFPVSEEHPAVLYWFSQTIGPGRGLEAAIGIMARMRVPTELHLRGFVSPDYTARLRQIAVSAGVKRDIRFLPPAPAGEMVRLAASASLGLSVEETAPLNRDLCLTNKVFAYLLAGIPQWLSDTSAQRELAPSLDRAALLGSLEQPEETARRLDAFIGDPERLAAGRKAAWELGHTRYHWDLEKHAFLSGLIPLLSPGIPRPLAAGNL